ncbi:MAG TPA: ChbG/HpnK family deacetylase [Proteobacteria bacterium]|nr:ChbG/HpnK family deacetylase [Pseudomonadota bacterium]
MIRLIINADDLGSGPQRDRGILHAFERGLVTSASLLANGSSFTEAARLAQAATAAGSSSQSFGGPRPDRLNSRPDQPQRPFPRQGGITGPTDAPRPAPP